MANNWFTQASKWLDDQGYRIPSMGDVDRATAGTLGIGTLGKIVGAPIGAAGSLLGTAMSEAETENPGSSDYLSAAKEGAVSGAGDAADQVSILDVASLAAGGAGGLLSKGAKAAIAFDDLAGANRVLKAAKIAQRLDTGLSAADAAIGAGQTVTGINEGDYAKAAAGVARVAGNAYGAHSSLKDLGEGRALKSIIDELGLKDTQALDVADSAVSTGVTKAGKKIAPRTEAPYKTGEFEDLLDRDGPAKAVTKEQEQELEFDARHARAGEVLMDMGKKYPVMRNQPLGKMNMAGEPDRWMTTVDQLESRTGETFTIEAVDTPQSRLAAKANGSNTTAGRDLADAVVNHAPTREALGDYVTWLRQVGEEVVDTLTGRISNAQDVMMPDGTQPLAQFSGSNKIRGLSFGGNEHGSSFTHKSLTRKDELGRPLLSWNNPVLINPNRLAIDASNLIDNLLTKDIDPSLLQKALEPLSDDAKTYIMGVRAGEQRIPGLEEKFKAQQFMGDSLYVAGHEVSGHAREDSGHRGSLSSYHEEVWSKNGNPMRRDAKQRSLDDIINGNASMFDPANNVLVSAINDPTQLPISKRLLSDNDRSLQFYRAALGEKAQEAWRKAPRRTGRTADLKATKAAKAEFAAEEPPTPPGDQPPGPPAGEEPFGPQLKPLSERIRTTLLENRKVNVLNNQNKAEIRALKAQELQKIDDELASGRMTNEEAVAASSKVMSGEFGLEKSIAQMPITAAEKQMMTERLAQVQEEDRFVRMNNRESWAKMLKGERLTDGEVKSITDALNIKIEELKETPTIMKMLKAGENLIGGSRALMSSWDLSAAGRQALFASVTNPREAMKAFRAQMDALKMTPKEFASFMDTFNDPNLNPMRDLQAASGLHISHKQGGLELGGREEHFINAAWAEKVPGVLRTEQAYIAYLNKMRVELFNKGAKQLMDSGHAIQDADGIFNPIYQDLAYMVNTLTGRGEMSAVHISPKSGQGKLMGLNATFAPGEAASKNMHAALTNIFFAPRFAASRAAILRDATIGLAGGNLEWPVYKMYMKNVYGTIGVMGSLAAAVVATGAGTFNADPSRKDFGVLRVGKVRYDLFGGLKPWAKIAALIEQDKYYDKSGKAHKFGEYGGRTKTGDIGRFVQGKLSPASSLLLEAVTGEDFMGKKSTAWNKAYSHFTPMILQTITEAIDEGEAEQLPLAVPAAVLGIGVNTYSDSRRKYQ